MTVCKWLILALWLLFVAYWSFMAVGAKQSIGARFRGRDAGVRLAIIVLILAALRVPVFHDAVRSSRAFEAGTAAGIAGLALCALGLGFAVWARICLGRNWGMPMSRKADPELVTGGPYAFVRHPIYTGMILAMLGSAIGMSVVWLLPLLLFGGYFIYSARREETLMLAQFPEDYAAYMRRTKMLVPFFF